MKDRNDYKNKDKYKYNCENVNRFSGLPILLLRGKLTIKADGPFTERLINICMRRGLYIDEVKKVGKNRVVFVTDIQSYKQMRIPAKKTKSKTKIIKKQGLPFIVRRFRHRKAAFLSVAAVTAVLFYCSTHIMGITVYGNNRVEKERILEELKNCGVDIGVRTSLINPDFVRNTLITKIDDLAWLGVNANGSHIYIEAVERIEKENGVVKGDVPCNLVAAKDGVIERTTVRLGQTLVGKGYGVIKGDVLVSGVVNNGETGFEFVHARGEVYGKTTYIKSRTYPLKYTEEAETGKLKNRYSINILNHTLPLYFRKKLPYEDYKYYEETKEIRLPVDILPSVFIRREEYKDIKTDEKTRTEKEAAELGKTELLEELKAELSPETVIDEVKCDYTLNEHGEAEVTLEVVCIENIAEESVIEEPITESESESESEY